MLVTSHTKVRVFCDGPLSSSISSSRKRCEWSSVSQPYRRLASFRQPMEHFAALLV